MIPSFMLEGKEILEKGLNSIYGEVTMAVIRLIDDLGVRENVMAYFKDTEHKDVKRYICERCGNCGIMEYYNYCPNCGVKVVQSGVKDGK